MTTAPAGSLSMISVPFSKRIPSASSTGCELFKCSGSSNPYKYELEAGSPSSVAAHTG